MVSGCRRYLSTLSYVVPSLSLASLLSSLWHGYGNIFTGTDGYLSGILLELAFYMGIVNIYGYLIPKYLWYKSTCNVICTGKAGHPYLLLAGAVGWGSS